MEEKDSAQVLSDLLREQGFSVMIKVTSYLFLPPEFRPAPEVLKECLKGVTMRNAIMHALTDNKGQYKIKGYVNIEISNAYSAVFKVYECFVKAIEAGNGGAEIKGHSVVV